jgi:hypothetical protein
MGKTGKKRRRLEAFRNPDPDEFDAFGMVGVVRVLSRLRAIRRKVPAGS